MEIVIEKEMKYTTIFFDLDDTLVDTVQNNKEALEDIYNYYQVKDYFPAFEEFYTTFQKINSGLWEKYAHGEITKDYLKESRFLQTFKEIEDISVGQSLEMNDAFLSYANTKKNVIEGSKEILQYLYPKYNLYILSNGFEEVQSYKMNNAGINSYFKEVILSDHIGKNKPHPDIFDYALKKANTTYSESLMIGDNLNTDISGAGNSGIDQVWFNPHNSMRKDNINPTYTINRLEELKSIL